MRTLHVLLPPLASVDANDPLRRWLARGDHLPGVPDARRAMTRELFRFAGDGVPTAALRHHAHADDAASGVWVCADPAYVRSEATGARLMTWPLRDVTAAEASAFASTLRPLLGDAGAPLEIDTPAAWCAHLQEAPAARFTRPVDALGVSLIDCLPEGGDGRRWRRLFNEAQIALHTHPANAARVAAGKVPVNALWFWGAGSLPGSVASPVGAVASRDDTLRGLAKIAAVACIEPDVPALDATPCAGDVLLDLDDPGGTGGAGAWLDSFGRWLHERRFQAVGLTFASGERFWVRPGHRLRVWRR